MLSIPEWQGFSSASAISGILIYYIGEVKGLIIHIMITADYCLGTIYWKGKDYLQKYVACYGHMAFRE